MLAFMPQSPALPDLHASSFKGAGTMSLALLPSSPMTYSQQAVPTLLPPGPSPSKRPKLSLNTANVAPVFGKESTSLRLETLSATSPTARNTFQNRQKSERTPGARLKKLGLTPLSTNVATASIQPPTPSQIQLPSSANTPEGHSSSATSATSTSTTDSLPSGAPYKLPFNATSILTNGPIARMRTRTMSFAQSRRLFPTAKKVSFRAPLTEDVKASLYTMRHSDIESPSSADAKLEVTPPKKGRRMDGRKYGEKATRLETDEANAASTQTGHKRESSDEEDDSESTPVTPVAGRRKRHRQWVWTLGPVSSPSNDTDEGETASSEATAADPGTAVSGERGADSALH